MQIKYFYLIKDGKRLQFDKMNEATSFDDEGTIFTAESKEDLKLIAKLANEYDCELEMLVMYSGVGKSRYKEQRRIKI